MRYTRYSIEDFVTDDNFRSWVLGRKAGDEAFWSGWVEAHSEMKPVLEEARNIILGLQKEEVHVSQQEIDEQFEAVSHYFDKVHVSAGKTRSLRFIMKIAAAALILITVGVGLYQFQPWKNSTESTNNSTEVTSTQQQVAEETGQQETTESNDETMISQEQSSEQTRIASNEKTSSTQQDTRTTNSEQVSPASGAPVHSIQYATNRGEQQKITLPDGSVVFLNERSTLAYTDNWSKGADREVQLQGEAYFQVEEKVYSGQKVKFMVVTRDVTVEVVGTEFNVNDRKQGTRVFLNEGRVRLSLKNLGEIINMVPGDLVQYDAATGQVDNRRPQQRNMISWLEGFEASATGGQMILGTAQSSQGNAGNNRSQVLQEGDNNNAYIEQVGNNLTSRQVQVGRDNDAQATMTNSQRNESDNANWSTWQLQGGSGNISIVNMMESNNSNVYSGQMGKGNTNRTDTRGEDNLGLILQYGEGNDVVILQDGVQNQATIFQGPQNADGIDPNMLRGRYNEVNIMQQGINNNARTIQKGAHNKADIKQKGN
jgi:ferric-dicitrate binding protein FerR (iron transport regulator)